MAGRAAARTARPASHCCCVTHARSAGWGPWSAVPSAGAAPWYWGAGRGMLFPECSGSARQEGVACWGWQLLGVGGPGGCRRSPMPVGSSAPQRVQLRGTGPGVWAEQAREGWPARGIRSPAAAPHLVQQAWDTAVHSGIRPPGAGGCCSAFWDCDSGCGVDATAMDSGIVAVSTG